MAADTWDSATGYDPAAEGARDLWDQHTAVTPSEGENPRLDQFLTDRRIDRATLAACGVKVRVVGGDTQHGVWCGGGAKWRSLDRSKKPFVEPSGAELTSHPKLVCRPGGSDTLVVVEGETDMLALWQATSADVMMLTTAKGWRPEWVRWVERYGRVVVATDADPAGDEGAAKVARSVPDALRLRPTRDKDWCGAIVAGELPALDDLPVVLEPIDTRVLARAMYYSERLNRPATHRSVVAEVHRELKDEVTRDGVAVIVENAVNPPQPIDAVNVGELIESITTDPDTDDDWIVADGQLARGEVLGVYGPANSGKSRLVLQFGLSVAAGVPFFLDDRFALTRARRVGYITGEGSYKAFRSRVFKMSGELSLPSDDMFVAFGRGGATDFKIDRLDKMDWLTCEIRRLGVEVMIFDSFRNLHLANENDSAEMEVVWSALKRLCAMGVTVVVSHHTRKGASGGRNMREAARGGSFVENLGAGWALDFADPNDEENTDRVLRVTKVRDGRIGPPLNLVSDEDTLVYKVSDVPAGGHAGLYEAVQAAGGELPFADLVDAMEKPRNTVRRWVEKDDRLELVAGRAGGTTGTVPAMVRVSAF